MANDDEIKITVWTKLLCIGEVDQQSVYFFGNTDVNMI